MRELSGFSSECRARPGAHFPIRHRMSLVFSTTRLPFSHPFSNTQHTGYCRNSLHGREIIALAFHRICKLYSRNTGVTSLQLFIPVLICFVFLLMYRVLQLHRSWRSWRRNYLEKSLVSKEIFISWKICFFLN